MRNYIFLLSLLLACTSLSAQHLAGVYSITDQGGKITLSLQYTTDQQLQGNLTDQNGSVYQAEATEEDGVAFGILRSGQEGVYFRAIREGSALSLTLIPAGQDGQPNPAAAQEFILTADAAPNQSPSVPSDKSDTVKGPLAGPLGGAADTQQWEGTFNGSIANTPTSLTLQQDRDRLSGQMDAGGYRYTLEGQITDRQSSGQVFDPQTQGKMPYQARLEGATLHLTIGTPANGQVLEVAFTRTGAAPPGPAPANSGQSDNYERDTRLIGSWIYTESYVSGDFSAASQWRMIIQPDGTYLYGDGRVIGGNSGVSGDSGTSGDVSRGKWRTQNGLIYIDEGGGWQPYCRYTTDGSSLLLRFGDGSKQLWKRSG